MGCVILGKLLSFSESQFSQRIIMRTWRPKRWWTFHICWLIIIKGSYVKVKENLPMVSWFTNQGHSLRPGKLLFYYFLSHPLSNFPASVPLFVLFPLHKITFKATLEDSSLPSFKVISMTPSPISLYVSSPSPFTKLLAILSNFLITILCHLLYTFVQK